MPEASSGFGHLFDGKPLVGNIRMASYSFDASGIFTVTLEDGEVWQESSSWPALANWKLPAESYYVSILPGVLGRSRPQNPAIARASWPEPQRA